MGTVAGLGVIEVSSEVIYTDGLSLNLASAGAVMVVSERHKKHGHIHFMLAWLAGKRVVERALSGH